MGSEMCIRDREDILDSQEYYESECKRIDDFQLMIEQWIAKASSGPCENAVSVVNPEDSVSNVGSRSQITIEQWIAKASSGPCENAVSVVHPEDSVSNV